MNKKICFYSTPYPKVKTYFDMIDAAVKHGINKIEGFNMLDLSTPDIEHAKKIKEYADKNGVTFPCLTLYVDLAKMDYDELRDRIFGYIDVAEVLGAPYIHHTIVADCGRPEYILSKRDEFYELGLKLVREVYDYGQTKNIRAVYEEQGFIFNGVKNFAKFLKDVNRDVGVVIDVANVFDYGDDEIEFVKEFADKAVHVHLKDALLNDTNEDGKGYITLGKKYYVEVPVGKGIVRTKEAIDILKKAGYDGNYALEYSLKEDNEQEMNEILEYIDSLL